MEVVATTISDFTHAEEDSEAGADDYYYHSNQSQASSIEETLNDPNDPPQADASRSTSSNELLQTATSSHVREEEELVKKVPVMFINGKGNEQQKEELVTVVRTIPHGEPYQDDLEQDGVPGSLPITTKPTADLSKSLGASSITTAKTVSISSSWRSSFNHRRQQTKKKKHDKEKEETTAASKEIVVDFRNQQDTMVFSRSRYHRFFSRRASAEGGSTKQHRLHQSLSQRSFLPSRRRASLDNVEQQSKGWSLFQSSKDRHNFCLNRSTRVMETVEQSKVEWTEKEIEFEPENIPIKSSALQQQQEAHISLERKPTEPKTKEFSEEDLGLVVRASPSGKHRSERVFVPPEFICIPNTMLEI